MTANETESVAGVEERIEFNQPEESRSRMSRGTIIPALLIVWAFGESMGNCRVPSIATDQSQLGLLSSEAGSCQGEDSHIPIPAGIASSWTRLMPVDTATDQSQLGLLSSLL